MRPMTPPRLEWLLPEPVLEPPVFAGFGTPVATMLSRRGFIDDPQLRRFLDAGAGALHDVSRMADAEVALERIGRAVDTGQLIAIWGDYDADGMTAVVVWVSALRRLGVEATRYIPSRIEEGYGLSEAGLRQLRADGVDLVITCDCGVTNLSEVAVARGIGLDVVITDHHLPLAQLPAAVAVVDPYRSDCEYPDPHLTGAGLAYKLAAALLDRRGVTTDGLAAIAAVGTVADMAPMTGESRAIVRLGLAELAASPNAGLRALLARAADHPERPTARDLAFGLVPRINAAGRIADAELAMRLLLETDAERAEQLAADLEEVHLRRREMTVVAVERARALADALPGDGPLVLRDDEWAPGLVGLIAGRLVDLLARPVAIATLVGGEVRGSVRAPVDFHVAAALEACTAHLTKRGGHAAAGGFSLRPEAWTVFLEAFGELARPFPTVVGVAPQRPGRVAVDLVLPARYVDWSFADQLVGLEPYGPGHVEPVLAVTGMELVEARRVGPKAQHLSLRLRRGLEAFDAVEFNADPERGAPEPGARLDLLGTLERDEFGGFPRLRMRLLDFADARVSPLAGRRRLSAPPALLQAG
jgi:single-stranded-DNA-specific exonuclease